MKIIDEALAKVAGKMNLNEICRSCEYRKCCKYAPRCEYMMLTKELDRIGRL